MKMFEGLKKSRFQSKCKSHLRLLETRLDTIRRKKNAVLKYMKNDVGDLLRNGLYINAYNRAEGLLIEQNISLCYQLIENFCGCISDHLSHMKKQSECPEECKEAIASLMYAAARFGDLPELRDLRKMFTEKYKNSFEIYTNKELVEKLKGHHHSKEMKLQLMQEIANELTIEWDPKALEQKLYTPPPTHPKTGSTSNGDDDYHKSRKSQNYGNKRNVYSYSAIEDGESDLNKLQSSSEDATSIDITQDGPKNSSSISVGSISDDDTDSNKPLYGFSRPPYLKPKPEKDGGISLEQPIKSTSHVENEINDTDDLVPDDKLKSKSVRRSLKPPPSRGNAESKTADDSEEDTWHRSRKAESNTPPAKASYLTPPSETTKGYAGAGSSTPEVLHSYPKLPDYDELVARIEALKQP